MRLEIPDSMVYVGTGILVDRVVTNIFGTTIKDVINNVLNKIGEAQKLREKEMRRVVDVMGDTLGYLDIKGNIVKGELNE